MRLTKKQIQFIINCDVEEIVSFYKKTTICRLLRLSIKYITQNCIRN